MLSEFKGHEDSVKCSIFLPQQVTWKRLILSVSDDRTVRVWNTEDGSKENFLFFNLPFYRMFMERDNSNKIRFDIMRWFC